MLSLNFSLRPTFKILSKRITLKIFNSARTPIKEGIIAITSISFFHVVNHLVLHFSACQLEPLRGSARSKVGARSSLSEQRRKKWNVPWTRDAWAASGRKREIVESDWTHPTQNSKENSGSAWPSAHQKKTANTSLTQNR